MVNTSILFTFVSEKNKTTVFVFFINVMLSVRPTQAWELIGSVVDRVITLPSVAKVGQKSDRFNEDKRVSQVRVSSSNVCVCWKFLLMIISFNLVPPVWLKFTAGY